MFIAITLIITACVARAAADLDEVIHREGRLAWDSEKEKNKLISLLSTINSALQEAEGKSTYSQTMLQWLQKIHNTVDDAMILLYSFPSASFFNKKARSTRDVLQIFDNLVKEKSFIFNTQETSTPVAIQKETDPFLSHSEIYGRERAKEEIVNCLLDDTCQENISVIPMVGLPGIGKTALAKLVYNDERVERQFEKGMMIWVWIPHYLDVKKIVTEVLESALGIRCDYLNFYTMKIILQNILHETKFLLVLDNVCSESGNWEELRSMLAAANHGSKVVITTSNNRVANIVKTTTPYIVEKLKESDCWSIFKHAASRGGLAMNTIFSEIGMNIANKSKGVPRVAEELGKLMMLKYNEGEWHDTESCEIWNLSAETNQILPMFRLSYKDLPRYAYQCFAYCSIFPRNYEICNALIIRHWMAHDFISSEIQGQEAIDHFLDRFFFEPFEKDEDGLILTFKLHELAYDLARYEMKTIISRHFCSDMKTTPNVPEEVPNLQYLRTYSLLNSPSRYISQGPRPMINQLKLLRVLDMSYTRDTSFINSAANLHQLRCINLSGTDIEKLPSNISGLSKLQSLILRNCSKLKSLPADTWKMQSLRHIDIEDCGSLAKMPDKLGQLRLLQTLPIFVIGRKGGTVRELGTLNLQGRLHIKCLDNVATLDDVNHANLREMKRLRTLSLSWDDKNTRRLVEDAEVLNALKPHYYLNRLSIVGYTGKGFPHWFDFKYLQNLIKITLSNCRSCEGLPPLGELPCLKSLVIDGFDSVIHFGKSLYGVTNRVVFPSLEKIICSNLICLADWEPENRVLFPNLSIFVIKNCPKLKNIPRLYSEENKLEHLEIEDCPCINSIEEINSLHTLKILKMIHCDRLRSLPSKELKGLCSLQDLLIQNCEKLTSVDGLIHLVNLRKLKITRCPNLLSSTNRREYLRSLHYLTIHSCPKLTFFPRGPLEVLQISSCSRIFETSAWAESLTHLEYLTIAKCDNLTNLPLEMKAMAALKKLQLVECQKLVALPEWLTSLTSLINIKIKCCHLLKDIPDEISKHLRIKLLREVCHHLNERCEESSSSRKRTSEVINKNDSFLQRSAKKKKGTVVHPLP